MYASYAQRQGKEKVLVVRIIASTFRNKHAVVISGVYLKRAIHRLTTHRMGKRAKCKFRDGGLKIERLPHAFQAG